MALQVDRDEASGSRAVAPSGGGWSGRDPRPVIAISMFWRSSIVRCRATVNSEGYASVRGSLDEGDEDPGQQARAVFYCPLGKASLVIMVLALQASPVLMRFLTFQRTGETQDQVKEPHYLIDLLSAKRAASECRNPLPGTDGIGAFIDPKTLARACSAIRPSCNVARTAKTT